MSDAVQQAAKDGDIPVLKKASKKDLNRRGEDGWTPVHWVAWSGHTDALSVILDKGGDPDVTDENGFSALHVAAKYGNTAAAEVMLNKEVNLWALDNQGRTPARVAALANRAECCRFLDALAIRWQMQNPDYASKMQQKAMKELGKRVQKEAKSHKDDKRDSKKKEGERRERSGSGEIKSSSTTQLTAGGRRKKHSTPADMLRQNFELRPTVSADQINDTSTTTTTSSEDEEGGILRPAGVRTGPLLNNLKSLAKGQPPGSLGKGQGRGRGMSQESGLGSEVFVSTSTSPSIHSGELAGLPDVVLTSQPIVIENDSALATFLQSLDLIDHIQLLHREKLDLEALALCEEKDLSDIGLPLGPRKKILKAIQRRQTLLNKPGRMTDTEL